VNWTFKQNVQESGESIGYVSAGEPMARMPKVAWETILRGTRRTLEIKEIFLKIFYILQTVHKELDNMSFWDFSIYISCDLVLVLWSLII